MSRAIINIDESLWRDSDHVEEGRKLIRLAATLYKPREIWCMCSGGNDSLCSTHLAMSTGLVTGVASINTTIGIRQTREHMQTVADKFKWRLKWLTPPMGYRELCSKFGMPGPGMHAIAYNYLKERCVRQLARDAKRGRKDRVMLISGARVQESVRRMGYTEAIQREGARIWVAPIINWTEGQKVVYQTAHTILRNPVKVKLGISGECLCGAFAKPGERNNIEQYYPEAFAEIVECERAAALNGKPSNWGKKPKSRKQILCQDCTRKNGDDV